MRVKTEARRTAIVDIAWNLFRQQGYERTTMSEVSARLGGSKGTLYGYFKSKDELFLAAMERMVADQGATAFESLEASKPLKDRLIDFASSYIAMRTNPDAIALERILIAEAGRSNLGEVIRERLLVPQWRRFAEALQREAASGNLHIEDPDQATSDFRALLTMPILEHCLYENGQLNKQERSLLAENSVDTFLRAYF